VNADATAALVKQIPVRRTGTPEDVGAACVYLGSDEASWMTGQTLHLDGGSTFS
jgi:3-oxoacyl-[acyl-carrier protein] reductase